MNYSTANILIAIPVRMSSQRLPGKPLAEIEGQTLVERVWRRAMEWAESAEVAGQPGKGQQASGKRRVVVATDSDEIADVVRAFGAEVCMTSSECENGSARVGEAAKNLAADGPWDVVVNVQGDMPFIQPALIEETIKFLVDEKWDCSMATAATPILDEQMFESRSVVKVVVSAIGEALYFSRSPIPHSRDGDRLMWKGREVFGFRHFGLYAYKPEALSVYTEQASPLERLEKLEQLRLLEKGHRIAACVVDPALTARSVEVDTPDDLKKACEIAREG